MLARCLGPPRARVDPAARAATSGFALMPPAVVDRIVAELGRALAGRTWAAATGPARARRAHIGPALIVGRASAGRSRAPIDGHVLAGAFGCAAVLADPRRAGA